MISIQKELSKRVVLSTEKTKEERERDARKAKEDEDWEILHKKTKSPYAWGPPPDAGDTKKLEKNVDVTNLRQWRKFHSEGEEKLPLLNAPGPRVKCQCEDAKCADKCAKEIPEAALVNKSWCPECAMAIAKRRIDQIKNG